MLHSTGVQDSLMHMRTVATHHKRRANIHYVSTRGETSSF